MKIITKNNLTLSLGESEDWLISIAEKELQSSPAYFRILKKSLDARKKNDIKYVYSIEFSAEKVENNAVCPKIPSDKIPSKPIVIVGSGPAGLFCAVKLTDMGFKPIVIERGDSVDEREKKCRAFFLGGELNENSNVQFGEGGAGTFSDGKLNTQTHSPINKEVLSTFVRFGAPKEIEYLSKPHVGSDNLKSVVKNMREHVISHGGSVWFNTRLTKIEKTTDGVKIEIEKNGSVEKIEPSAVVLAIGHSARDTFKMLYESGFYMTAKSFAVGVRIEHLQEKIGYAQYGEAYKKLPPADYKLVSHAGKRAAFSFCMCPGGLVMPATSEEGGVVTNGMSNYARNETNANSAIIVPVTQADFGDGVLAGVEFQRKLERNAFIVGGSNYSAPVQRVEDFLKGRMTRALGEVTPSYERGVTFAQMSSVLPVAVIDTLKSAVVDMDKKIKGFAHPDAILTAVESRTSSPVRIERGDDMQSVTVPSVYPCGEGAGYAGGITSSAADGIRVANAIFNKFND